MAFACALAIAAKKEMLERPKDAQKILAHLAVVMLSLCGSCLLGSEPKKLFCELKFPTSWSINSVGLFESFKRFMRRAQHQCQVAKWWPSRGKYVRSLSACYGIVEEECLYVSCQRSHSFFHSFHGRKSGVPHLSPALADRKSVVVLVR